MRREDLFAAIGGVDDKRLVRCEKYMSFAKGLHEKDTGTHKEKNAGKAGRKQVKRAVLLAAILALMLFLMGSAIAALVTMRVEKVKMFGQSGEKQEEVTIPDDRRDPVQQTEQEEQDAPLEEVYEGEKISFEDERNVFLELGDYYPQEIPDGYTMTFVSDDAPFQNRVIHYENEADGLIKYWIYLGDPASSIEIYGIEKKTDVRINGQPGILYTQKGGGHTLVWMNRKQGYGFALRANDAEVDLLAMAKSTAEGAPLTPTRSPETVKALEELGDYGPEYLPEGFVEWHVQGSPLAKGGGWYSYVRKWYVNKTENTGIYLEYESYRIVTEKGYTDDARTACSFFIPGYHILKGEVVGEETQINGMFGIVTKHDIAWADPQTRKVYHLYSKDIVGDELLRVAQSFSPKQPPTQ